MSVINEVLCPVDEDKEKTEEQKTSPRVAKFEGKVIGLLNNGVPNSFFPRLEQLLKERYPSAKVLHWKKVYGSKPAPADQLEDVIKNSDAVIVGVAI
ncbi:MAG: hypothetical protein ABIH46_06980 [Chloroflexota bacterium]